FRYVPAAGYVGSDSFTYRANDRSNSNNLSNLVTVRIVVSDSPPSGVADNYSVQRDSTLFVSATEGVLANDTDPDEDLMRASLMTNVAHGQLPLQPSGAFKYTPDAGFVGTDRFIYRPFYTGMRDGGAVVVQGKPTTVTLTVANGGPTARDDAYQTQVDHVL